jgi:hypothetical protein
MTQPTPALPSTNRDAQRLLADQRERIIALEAHGLPSKDADGLWDAMSDILAEMKRHQGLIGSQN